MELIKTNTLNYFYNPAVDPATSKGKIIFIHGYNASPHYFFLVDKYFQNYDCYYLGLPGHGLTSSQILTKVSILEMAKCVVDFINELKIEEFYLIGHSLGGAISCLVNQMIPTRIKKLVLANSYYEGFNKYLFNLIYLFPYFLKNNPAKTVELLYYDFRNNSNINPVTRFEKQSRLFYEKPGFLKKLMLNTAFSFKTRMMLNKAQANLLNTPTLLIYGDADKIIDPHGSYRKFNRPKNKIYQIHFDESGHLPHVEQPSAFAKKIICFFEHNDFDETDIECDH
ncbi:alpha/beta fold hydrolase [Ureaplasma zalophigenitalium]|uniref:Alpha/beta hydrolase n=1 Tax=Ureaplasma zalophigenitalium TaxID=907723 RepID=A0ABT3BNK7_9BACT|nr:alpha/beta hydrolase [Ureaplasma zalophigenitalium]MCV3753829.1 alpha/beta hydrolase [Ureaplasma zalophigenitalium]